MAKKEKKKVKVFPPQHQEVQPGVESEMIPEPISEPQPKLLSGKLSGKVAIITGGDSGIGKAISLLFAEEGAMIIIAYLNEHDDAIETAKEIEKKGQKVKLYPGDLSDEAFCRYVVDQAITHFGKIDIVVNNAGVQYPQKNPEDITAAQLKETFEVNVYPAFYLTLAALPFMGEGSSIINSTSVTAYRGSHHLIDYAATKGALVSFTRSLSSALAKRKIRVNAVAPGPIWTPLIPASFPEDHVETFGSDVPLGRAGQPHEAATCYLFLASEDASYITGQVLHPNGGEIING